MHPQYTCRYCGVLFTPHSPYNVKGCAHRRVVEPTTATCRQCGREFSRVLESSDGGTHCSRRCAAKTANQASLTTPNPRVIVTPRTCIRCGAPFTPPKPSSRKRYCSHRCYLSRNGAEHPNWKPKITLTCEHCQRPFQGYPYMAGQRRFCSRACKTQQQSTGRAGPSLLAPCKVCGAEFYTWPYRVAQSNGVRCRACATVGHPRTGAPRLCEICQTPFWAIPSQRTRRYCSRQCTGEAVRRGPHKSTSRDSVAYAAWREAVYRRDNWACRHCGRPSRRKSPIHAHHIQLWSTHPELRFDVDNGLTLCASCHAKVHFGQGTPLGRPRRTRQLALPL